METVIVVDPKHPNGEYIINKDDFDPSVHTLKGEESKRGPKPKTESGK